jgi:hypothetical protein
MKYLYSLCLLCLLSSVPCFAQIAAVTTPPNILTANAEWRAWRDARVAEIDAYCPLMRSTVYYFDQDAADDTGDGSIGDPFKTRAKAIELSAAESDVTFLFQRGDTWRETGQWILGDDESVGAYGDEEDPLPIFDRFTVRYLDASNAWGSNTGNRWQVTDATDVAWVKLAAFPLTRPLQRVATAGDVSTTPNSWCSTGGVLYINLNGDDPNTFDIDVCPSNGANGDEDGIEMAGDSNRCEDLLFYGWGCHRTDTASQSCGITITSRDDEASFVKGCEAYYSGSHALATNVSSTGQSGGVAAFVNCRAGYTKYNSSGETVFNTYAHSGEQECWFVNCDVPYGTLPSSDWTPATKLLRGQGFYGHTGLATGTTIGLVVIDNAFIDCAAVYGPERACYLGDPAVPATPSNPTTYRFFCTYLDQAMPTAANGPNTFDFLQYGIMYGCKLRFFPKAGGLSALENGSKVDGWLVNNYFTLNMGTVANANPFSMYNDSTSPLFRLYWWHNMIELTNAEATSASRWGIDYAVRAATSASGNGVLGGGPSATSVFKNNIMVINKTTGGNTYYLGMTNVNAQCTKNKLFGVTDSTNIERGYNNTTAITDTTGGAPVFGVSNPTLLEAGDTGLMLSHDINNKRRTVSTPDIGPVDFSSIAESDDSGVIQNIVEPVVDDVNVGVK